MGNLFNKKEERLEEVSDFYNLTQDEIREEFKKDPLMIRYLTDPTEEEQIDAVSRTPASIQFILNPSSKVRCIVAEKDYTQLKHCVLMNARSMNIVVKDHPEFLSGREWNEADTNFGFLKINPKCIKYMKQTPERQLLAVKLDIRMIEHIDYPTEEVQLYVLMKDPSLIKWIKYPTTRALALTKK